METGASSGESEGEGVHVAYARLASSDVMYVCEWSFRWSRWFLTPWYRIFRTPTLAATVCSSQLPLTSHVRQSGG